VGGFSHIVASVEKSVEFYRDVLGLVTPSPPRAFDSTQWIIDMGNTPGAQSRPAILHIPGSKLGVELIDYKDIDREAAHAHINSKGGRSHSDFKEWGIGDERHFEVLHPPRSEQSVPGAFPAGSAAAIVT
jgi:hypothetical protein